MQYTAWVDESESNHRRDPDTYLLAAALVNDTDTETVRERMRALLLPGQRKLHWHDESAKRRTMIIGAVAELDAIHLVVVRCGRPGEHPERHRRKCLERLLYEADHVGVGELVAEARKDRQSRRDLDMLAALRAQHLVSVSPQLQHARGSTEPMPWLPDIVAGAVVASRCGSPDYLDAIRAALEIIELTPG